MIVDLYRRAESGNKYSYLAVPTGKLLPEEVTGTDWQVHSRQWDLEQEPGIPSLLTADVVKQIDEKRYAITHLNDQIRS
ncbi:DUF6139 family protein [Undibacterium terreum]|uniref:Uncharacterized protein n=1 Tax=Undibacterium terreum TaxID=1224302 RepID=A0A916U6N6_9BURK|nr:DUF6139 family protein [Undibacterium terreum]GGC62606.1 hypothetical protein GCM10011396_06960 [Undibacterium terreum]